MNHMNRALILKFVLTYVLFAFLGIFVIATLGEHLIKKELTAQCGNQMYREATSIASSQSTVDADTSQVNFIQNLKLLADYQKATIWVIDPAGVILADTSRPAVDEASQEKIDGFDPALTPSGYYRTGRFYDYFDADMVSVMVPATHGMTISAYIAIHTPMTTIQAQAGTILYRIYILFGIVFLLSLLILGLFAFSVYRPLKKIIYGASEYAAGHLTYQIPIQAEDEMGYLAQTLNYMSSELAKTGDYQRNFVANVSHDFRSPLTSIKGYAEAMLDGTIPVEMQGKYLEIITSEADRLNKLTESLLTLNDIDKGRILDMSSFDINAVIKQTAAVFEGTCRTKRISIELIFETKEQYVLADMSKIQQVLYNLIDNAIKFSHKDSSIFVETMEKHGKVYVSVKDTGIGIPADSVNKIWERFYKIDASRGKDRKGTGLGLSIVKEIMNAHEQNINVISTVGVGTEFLFSLEKGR